MSMIKRVPTQKIISRKKKTKDKPEMYRRKGSKEDLSLARIYFSVNPIDQGFN